MREFTGLRCSFCGKRREEVEKLIAGPGVYICSECVGLCDSIIAEARQEAPAPVLVPQSDRYRLHVSQADGADVHLDYPLPLGTTGVHLRVVTSGGTWGGPCRSCGAWTARAAEQGTCFHCGEPLPAGQKQTQAGAPPPEGTSR